MNNILCDGIAKELVDKEKQLAKAQAEIERKDKLIEQMRGALVLVKCLSEVDVHFHVENPKECLCWKCQINRIEAALAAERGG